MSLKKFYKFKKINLLDAFFLFLPFSIIIGNLFINLTTMLILIFGIKSFYKKFTVFFKEYNKLILILLIFIILNFIFSSNQLTSLRSILGITRYLLLAIILYFWFLKNDNNLKIFLFSVIVSLIIVVCSVYFELFFKEFSEINYDRLSGIFFQEKVAGSYISKFLFIVIFFLYIYY